MRRATRRALADRKKARTKRWMRYQYEFTLNSDNRFYMGGKGPTYTLRLGPGVLKLGEGGNAIEIECDSRPRRFEWLAHRARLYRDNPQVCSCESCGNQRVDNTRLSLTLQERKAHERFLDQWKEVLFESRNLQQDALSLLRAG
jgi:hypothetical protein